MALSEDKIICWLRLTRVPGLGPVLGGRLLAAFGSVEAIFEAEPWSLGEVEGIGKTLARALLDPAHLEAARKDLAACQERGIRVIPREDPDYPSRLAGISDPPLVLFVRGSLVPEDEAAIALVGCRTPDPYGESMATSLAAGLARYGITVVSGLARGIDGIAQRAALKAGGRSIAVLGTGVDVIYPAENKALYEELGEKGAVISEFPLGTPPDPGHFPRRNRIISGLALGVVMVQALNQKSGALITVKHALEQNREVYAVPGNVGSRAGRIGNSLIKQGAKLVETAEDIVMDVLPLGTVEIADSPAEARGRKLVLPDLQAKLFALVPGPADGTVDIDALVRQAGISPAEAAAALLELELAGLLRALPGKRYVRLTE